MNFLDSSRVWSAAAAIALPFAFTTTTQAQVVVLDDFEFNEGHFASNPVTASGTSQGFNKANPGPTIADRTTTDFFDGLASQLIVIDDDPNVPGSTANTDSWRLRHLSGGGTPANNVGLAMVLGNTSFVGYWLKTTTSGMEAGIGIDDAAALEIGRWQSIAPDGQWHFYQWQLQDANDWDAFAGTGPNGAIDNASVTLDCLFFRDGINFPTGLDFDAQFNIDRVSYNPTGSIAVPEPAAAGLLVLSGIALAPRRRRAWSPRL